MLKNIVRALRLPFITASILPFIFGSLIERADFNYLGFFLGLLAAISVHVSANLINDYADSQSGADAQDKRFFGFFGGSKLIQENVFSARAYLLASVFFALLATASVVALAAVLENILVIVYFIAIVILSWQYSAKPCQFSYRRMGELILFLLFGPAPVMGGYFIQTGVFPDLKSFILSIPFGLLTTAILFANEVPDYPEDNKVKKMTWVSITGADKAYLLYFLIIISAFAAIIAGIWLGYLGKITLISFILIIMAIKAAGILKKHYNDKTLLMRSSAATINLQALVGIILIIGLFI
ncbi:MAG: prenyltransferase [Candidatus Omnitrophica bacterium]|nr:prenyltransferase [Candidatus Omnitrophota bacterium]